MRLPKGAKVTDKDLDEIERFGVWLGLEASRKAGGDPTVLNTLEAALYPEGVGREPIDGKPEA